MLHQSVYMDFSTRGWPLAQFDAAAYKEQLEKLKDPTQDSEQAPADTGTQAEDVVVQG